MSKLVRTMQNYLVYALPFVLAVTTWGTLQSEREIVSDASFFVRALWEVLSWNIMLWFVVLVLFLILLVVFPDAREKTLRRLANLQERDEREQFITGKASRAAYISTLSVLIFFLFLSIFTLKIYRLPEGEEINGKRGVVHLGMQFNLLDEARIESSPTGQVLFESKDIPLSKTAIVMIVIIWQLAAFNLVARREKLRV